MTEFKYASIQGDGDVRRVALQNELNAPISRVWEAVTTVDQIQHWWPDWRPGGVIEPNEGGSTSALPVAKLRQCDIGYFVARRGSNSAGNPFLRDIIWITWEFIFDGCHP